VAFIPRRRSLPQLAALGAAVLIAVQLAADHWFYLYIPWFLALLLPALVATDEPAAERVRGREEGGASRGPGGSSSHRRRWGIASLPRSADRGEKT
jgi:hypothetical protein